MGDLVSIAEFDNATEAHILKSRLESEGIPCYLTNENLNTLMLGISFARVRLQVPLEESIRAVEILFENPSEPPISL